MHSKLYPLSFVSLLFLKLQYLSTHWICVLFALKNPFHGCAVMCANCPVFQFCLRKDILFSLVDMAMK